MTTHANTIARSFYFFISFLLLSAFSRRVIGVSEILREYNSPQARSMGNAFTADAFGYSALYYNPAGLAKAQKKTWDVTPIDIEGTFGATAIGLATAARSLGLYRMPGTMAKNPGKYNYFDVATVPGYSQRGFGVSLLGNYQYAGISHDGVNLDVNASETVGMFIGGAINLLGNCLKIGVTGKALIRNELNGVYAISSLSSDQATAALMKEGFGFGGDLGMMLTLPNRYLPSFGVVWKDVLNTYFHSSHVLNPRSSGAPDMIPQTVNIATSFHYYLSRRWRSTYAIEFSDIASGPMPLQKRLHFGMQFEDSRSLYLWAGLNQLYPTMGVGLRVKGGTLEIGSDAQDIGTGDASQADRRFYFRYTIGI